MTPQNLDEQLTMYLTDAHSIERQALAQLATAPKIAGDERIAAVFSEHLAETKDHERLVQERLDARGAKPSPVKNVVGTLTGKGFTAFAKSQPDTPGKLVVHAFSYEHMEEAAYDLLGQTAERACDNATVDAAHRIEEQERAMGDRLAACFDVAVEAALRELDPDDIQQQLNKYLADAHAIEAQALQLLEKSSELAGTEDLAAAFEQHRVETDEHQRLVAARLDARGETPSKIKDAALRLGALNWGAFFQAQPDTPAKLAAFAYAFEHLEIGAYEMLRRVAARASDSETERLAERILPDEHEAADRVRSLFAQALDAALGAQRITAR
jgi:ferritin-like metal-binding protein YciE